MNTSGTEWYTGPCKAPGETGQARSNRQKARRWGKTISIQEQERKALTELASLMSCRLPWNTGWKLSSKWQPNPASAPNPEPNTLSVRVDSNQGAERKAWLKCRLAVLWLASCCFSLKPGKREKGTSFRSGRAQHKPELNRLYVC